MFRRLNKVRSCVRSVVFVALVSLFAACSAPKQEDELTATEAAPIPQEVLDMQQRAVVAMQANEFGRAIVVLEEAVNLYPRYPGLHVNLGIARSRANQDERALQAFQGALAVDAENPVAHNYIGILSRKAGRFDDARKSYQRALLVDETYSLAHLNLGILCDIYLQDFDCALKHYEAYEKLQTTVDKQFKGWKIDLERRIKRKNKS